MCKSPNEYELYKGCFQLDINDVKKHIEHRLTVLRDSGDEAGELGYPGLVLQVKTRCDELERLLRFIEGDTMAYAPHDDEVLVQLPPNDMTDETR